MGRTVIIDPITRLEGHGKIAIFLDDEGNVVNAYLQVPELRGFEKFLVGRPAEDAPQITSRICGVCPTAHHMAATKALDDLYAVEPPSPARKVRELVYNLFMFEDHALHFYVLGGPDFIVGPKAPKAERNVFGVLKKVGSEVGLKVIKTRKAARDMITAIAGKVIHPVFGLPGGIAKPVDESLRSKLLEVANSLVDFALFTRKIFKDLVLSNREYLDLILSDAYTHRTYYMGLVDDKNRLNFYDGKLRIVDPRGREYAKFDVHEYLNYVAEHIEPWTYIKFPYLKTVGWKGFIDGPDSGILCVAPLARLNVSDSMATPMAQQAFEEMYETLGEKPVHYTLATHWARVIEIIYAAERIKELAEDPDIESREVLNIPTKIPGPTGIGVVEAPRGVLIHHYESDERGILRKANLLVATQWNAARINMSIDKAARALIRGGEVREGLLNMIEMAFRAYDPCHACGTHALPGELKIIVELYNEKGELLEKKYL
ncbi:MAG: Ni/Fe hydrogenase subunit alpha, partial [Sulfolobales archaeon]